MNPELLERLSALVDGELEPAEAAELRAEAARDPELAARLRELESVDAALRALPAPAVPADAKAQLRARIREEADVDTRQAEPSVSGPRTGGRAPARPGRQWRMALGAAAAIAAAILMLLLLPSSRPEQEAVPVAGADVPQEAPAPTPLETRDQPAVAAEDLDLPDLLDPLPDPEGLAAEDPAADDPFAQLAEDAPTASPTPPEPGALPDASAEDVIALASDLDAEELPVIEVLDWLAELDELEAPGRSG